MRFRLATPTQLLGWLLVLALVTGVSATDTVHALDRTVASVFSQAHGSGIDVFMLSLSELLRPLHLGPAALVLAALLWWRLRRQALLIPVAFVAATILTYLMKWVIGRERPGGALALVDLGDAAYPSAHVSTTTATGMATMQVLAPVLARSLRKLIDAAVIALIGAVALSRVWVGAHWLSDVIAGLIVGVVGLVVALLVLRRLPPARRRRFL